MIATILGQILIGWLLADLLTGVLHWVEDRFGREDMPLIGARIIAPNRLHHRQPRAFLQGGLLVRHIETWILVALLSGFWLWLLGASVTWAAATLAGLVVNEVHRLAHQPSRSRGAVRVLQEVGFIQSPPHHARHHRPPSDRAYCVLTDWLNPALDALQLWSRLEAVLASVGIRPTADVEGAR